MCSVLVELLDGFLHGHELASVLELGGSGLSVKDWPTRMDLMHDSAGESSTPFKDYVEDAPGRFFELLVGDWSRVTGLGTTADEISDFFAEHCPGWLSRLRPQPH